MWNWHSKLKKKKKSQNLYRHCDYSRGKPVLLLSKYLCRKLHLMYLHNQRLASGNSSFLWNAVNVLSKVTIYHLAVQLCKKVAYVCLLANQFRLKAYAIQAHANPIQYKICKGKYKIHISDSYHSMIRINRNKNDKNKW